MSAARKSVIASVVGVALGAAGGFVAADAGTANAPPACLHALNAADLVQDDLSTAVSLLLRPAFDAKAAHRISLHLEHAVAIRAKYIKASGDCRRVGGDR
jgi:hypothetical protein